MASELEGDSQDLRIVLLGVSGAGKSSTGNAILGRDVFKESRTRESETQRGRVEDRNISIIDTPGFFNTQLTDEEMKNEMMKSVYLCYPGPHVFLLVINLKNFEDDGRNLVEEIEEMFGAQVFKFTLVLFTGREIMSRKEWMHFIIGKKCKELVGHCRGNYHAINSKYEMNKTHITELLDKIDEFTKQNNHQLYNSEIFSLPRGKSIRMKKKTYKTKKQEITIGETFTTRNATEERKTHTVIEQVKETKRKESRKEKQQQEEITYIEKKQVKETFEMESAIGERKTHSVTEEERGSFVSYFRQTMRKKHTYENLDNESLHRFQDFSKEGMRNSTVGKRTEKGWGMGQKMKYQMSSTDEFRIVMVGKTGAGKSATGNTILGKMEFEADLCSESLTKKCKKREQKVQGRLISVIDTPGLYDTNISEERLKKEIEKCVEKSVPGPHVFLLVIRLDVKFTDEEKHTVKWIQKNFGKDAARYTIVLFTRGDQLKNKSIKEFLKENKPINDLVKQCKGRYHVFNNTVTNRSQVTELLVKIQIMVEENGGEYYTNEMYKEAQRKIMMKKAQDTALVGASVAGVGAAVAGGAVLVAATGGVALPAVLMAGGAVLTGGVGAAKTIVKHVKGKRRNSIDHDYNFDLENKEEND